MPSLCSKALPGGSALISSLCHAGHPEDPLLTVGLEGTGIRKMNLELPPTMGEECVCVGGGGGGFANWAERGVASHFPGPGRRCWFWWRWWRCSSNSGDLGPIHTEWPQLGGQMCSILRVTETWCPGSEGTTGNPRAHLQTDAGDHSLGLPGNSEALPGFIGLEALPSTSLRPPSDENKFFHNCWRHVKLTRFVDIKKSDTFCTRVSERRICTYYIFNKINKPRNDLEGWLTNYDGFILCYAVLTKMF